MMDPARRRDHDWSFDAGTRVRASASPAYLGNASCVDPEESFVASLSSCFIANSVKTEVVVEPQ
jgi:organic hydroperoxide reductase OsmC/OhrA